LNDGKFIFYKDGKGEFKFNLNWEPKSNILSINYLDILLYMAILLIILILFFAGFFWKDSSKRKA